jgi:hypothetical protein
VLWCSFDRFGTFCITSNSGSFCLKVCASVQDLLPADTVLTLNFVYYLDGKRATLISVFEDISILAYDIARSD